eukprot:scaffold42898_cov62-Phaeocystis_antarctica.AAC.5
MLPVSFRVTVRPTERHGARAAGRRAGRKRRGRRVRGGAWLATVRVAGGVGLVVFRLQAATNGAAIVVGERAALALHIVKQAFLLGLQLLVALLQPPLFLTHASLLQHLLRVGVAKEQLRHMRDGVADDERRHFTEHQNQLSLATDTKHD